MFDRKQQLSSRDPFAHLIYIQVFPILAIFTQVALYERKKGSLCECVAHLRHVSAGYLLTIFLCADSKICMGSLKSILIESDIILGEAQYVKRLSFTHNLQYSYVNALRYCRKKGFYGFCKDFVRIYLIYVMQDLKREEE